ncbi:DUF456 domain-containing protein [Gaetbulibacter aestuarii]|uniref:DUF456 domain-containing protein n=1 Tax=Gaetbulibacter aestuarii TaxID=1502358 RepID=A0ABW7MWJ1_9FLAO
MDIFLVCIAALFLILGLIGSLLPILPGPPLSWVGLLILYATNAIPMNWTLIIITFIIAMAIFVLDYIIPAMGSKRFGGTRAGMIGTSIGLVVGLLAPIPGGIIIGPFAGAFIGEMMNAPNSRIAFKSAVGSFVGFLASTFIKLVVAVIYFGMFLSTVWDYKDTLFSV